MTLHVDVTQADIEAGETGDCSNCPVALAVRRAAVAAGLPDADWVEVCFPRIKIGHVAFSFPRGIGQFVDDFDAGESVRPFSFDLDRPTYNWS
jgi:hypothetical protein